MGIRKAATALPGGQDGLDIHEISGRSRGSPTRREFRTPPLGEGNLLRKARNLC
ncbi:MAG: hypothetical protein HYT12_02290 [Candidatus Liptonbacteria bacterium]|nr:hypothetical protein [Candidatus Liptonbacteria bacterium]